MYDLLIKNGQLVTADRIYAADLAINDGKYAAILAPGSDAEAKEVVDAKGNLVFPGIIDCHAHLNEPGFEYREDFETGSRAAVSAGCTTLIEMPLNNDPSLMNKEIFDMKYAAISRHSYVDYALWGGIVGDFDDSPDSVKNNMADLVDLHEAGVAAFKGFGLLGRSGVYIIVAAVVAADLAQRVILLDGDAHLQLGVSADIGDAEASLAKRIADDVLTVEHRSGSQMVRYPVGHVLLVAVRTDSAGLRFLHAVKAIHTSAPFIC